MTTIGYVLLAAGLGLIGAAVILVACALQALNINAIEQSERLDRLESDVRDALVLARKRLVAGRSGR